MDACIISGTELRAFGFELTPDGYYLVSLEALDLMGSLLDGSQQQAYDST